MQCEEFDDCMSCVTGGCLWGIFTAVTSVRNCVLRPSDVDWTVSIARNARDCVEFVPTSEETSTTDVVTEATSEDPLTDAPSTGHVTEEPFTWGTTAAPSSGSLPTVAPSTTPADGQGSCVAWSSFYFIAGFGE